MIEVTIPQPIEWLNSNDRLHHMVKARRVAAWRGTAKLAARGLAPIEGRVRIVATVYKRHGRQYDAGNYYPTAKACVDGLRDAGVLVDDSNRYVVGPDMRHGGKSAEPCLHLTITEITTEGES